MDGDNIVIDYGVHSRLGMQAEMGRTMWVGTPDPKFADQCARHADATLDVCHNVLKPGMNRVEIQDAFMDAFRKVGLGDLLGDYLHMLGHNNGFRMPEPPSKASRKCCSWFWQYDFLIFRLVFNPVCGMIL